MNEENNVVEESTATPEITAIEKETDQVLETRARKKKKNSKSVSITVRLYPEQDKMLREALKKTGFSITAAVGNALQYWIEHFVDTNFDSESVVGREKWGD